MIERYRTLLDGEHALYYEVEPGDLRQAIWSALAGRDRLHSIATAAHAHVVAYRTPTGLARYTVEIKLCMQVGKIFASEMGSGTGALAQPGLFPYS